jgi:hypothetical protein
MIQVNYSNMMKYTDVDEINVINTFQPKGKSVIEITII